MVAGDPTRAVSHSTVPKYSREVAHGLLNCDRDSSHAIVFDVYGFDMTAMMAKIYDDILVRQVSVSNLASDSTNFLTLPLHTVTAADLTFTKEFTVKVSRDIDALSGWVVWFDTFST